MGGAGFKSDERFVHGKTGGINQMEMAGTLFRLFNCIIGKKAIFID